MDIKVLLITVILLAIAIAGLLIKILFRPESELPRSSCGGYSKDANGGDEKCAACDLQKTDHCPTGISSGKN